ncbi:PUA-like domain-containing protein [Scenedesmus sp. NREL 46B-D3]|nr:PUA-like domain-containing protein [Scenedesmus sp. NREL 46B-D3]
MIAFKELRGRHALPGELHGHIPGVAVGASFGGRGPLAILGLHADMMRGIMARASNGVVQPAYAICLAGGYKDDADSGATFWYTGEGGQDKKKQVKDQSYATNGNAALKASCEAGTPVRVFRSKLVPKRPGEWCPPVYSYEGLYRVLQHRVAPSADGPLVCQYEMQAVPGHSVVSHKVEFRWLHKASFQQKQLAEATAKPGRKRSSFDEDPAVRELIDAANKQFKKQYKGGCGIKDENYNEHGQLVYTHVSGHMECEHANCRATELCKWNRVVSGGIRYPLEVFKVSGDKGWGVRCSADLPPGAFICCYIGKIITDEAADALQPGVADRYLFDLSHFQQAWEGHAVDKKEVPMNRCEQGMAALLLLGCGMFACGCEGHAANSNRVPMNRCEQGMAALLLLGCGMFACGCEGHPANSNRVPMNRCEQGMAALLLLGCGMFACGCEGHAANSNRVPMNRSQLLFYTAIFTYREVPAGEELTYDYGEQYHTMADGTRHGFPASAGQPTARARLLLQTVLRSSEQLFRAVPME